MPPAWVQSLNPWQLQLVQWGGQTIAYAMSKRAMDIGRPLDGADRARLAWEEALSLVHEMYDAACAQAEGGEQGEVTMHFAERVLDWTVEHLTD